MLKKRYLVNIDRRGRFTLPREIREQFEILGGGEVIVVIEGNNVTIEFQPRTMAEGVASEPIENGAPKGIESRFPA